ncbi:Monocarboxylate transporter 13, partial [Lachnellula arida]
FTDMNSPRSSFELQGTVNFSKKPEGFLHRSISQQTSACHPTSLDGTAGTSRRRREQALIVISCLTLTFTGCGINFAFGVYQELYETLGGPFQNATPGEIDLIGTLSASVMTIGAPVVNALVKRYETRSITLLGGILFAVASIAASLGTRLWHFHLAQGLLQGCAACLTYIPAVTVSPGFFNERRGLAMGFITSGTGLGGMAWAPFLRYLITAIGFRNTLRVTGILAAVMISISASVLREVEEPSMGQPRDQKAQGTGYVYKTKFPVANWKLVRSNAFIAQASGTALQAAAYMTPVYFMSSYATTLGYTNTAGANIIALSNASNCGGKIIVGYLADRFGRLNALVLSTFSSAVATFGLWYISDSQLDISALRALLLAYACIYSITAGSFVSLFPTALAEQFGIRNFASVSGLLYMIRGVGTLIGTPIGGVLVRHSEGLRETASSFDRTFLFVAILLSGATISTAWARSIKGQAE